MQELHLADRYGDDESIRVHVKMLLALSCVSSLDVTNALESCPREIDPVLDYWEHVEIVLLIVLCYISHSRYLVQKPSST